MKRSGFTLLEVTLALALFAIGAAGALTLQAQSARLLRQAATLDHATEIGLQTLHGIRTSGLGGAIPGCRDPWPSAIAEPSACQVSVLPCDLIMGRLHCSRLSAGLQLHQVTVRVPVAGSTPLVITTLVGSGR